MESVSIRIFDANQRILSMTVSMLMMLISFPTNWIEKEDREG